MNDEFTREFARPRDFGDQVLEDEAIDIGDEHEDREETINTVNTKDASQTVIKNMPYTFAVCGRKYV